MKTNQLRYLMYLLLTGFLAGQPLSAQDTTGQFVRPAVLKTNLAGPISLILEVPTTNRQSLQVGVQYFSINFWGRTRHFSLTPAYKFYLSKSAGSARRPAPKGLYLSPYFRYRSVRDEVGGFWFEDEHTPSGTVSYNIFGTGAIVGAQFINRWGLTFDGFLGGGYNPLTSYRVIQYDPPNPPPAPDPNWLRYDIRIGLCIGIAFAQPRTP